MSRATVWAVIPLKDFVQAKQRLSGVLSVAERRQLFAAMVDDVLRCFSQSRELDRVIVLSDDAEACLLAEHYGLDVWRESELNARGLNAVVTAALRCAAELGCSQCLVAHGDLPLLTQAELDRFIQQHRSSVSPALSIAPDRRGGGSNMLCLPAASQFDFCYGENSFAAHCEHAVALGLEQQVYHAPGSACDIDELEDLLQLLLPDWKQRASSTLDYLNRSGIGLRLRAVAAGGANTDAHNREAQ